MVHAEKLKWRSALSRMEGAYAVNTIRSYRADFTIFEGWCRRERRTALPATPETVAAFVLAQSKSASHSQPTPRRNRQDSPVIETR